MNIQNFRRARRIRASDVNKAKAKAKVTVFWPEAKAKASTHKAKTKA
jgi:hypothetical protein